MHVALVAAVACASVQVSCCSVLKYVYVGGDSSDHKYTACFTLSKARHISSLSRGTDNKNEIVRFRRVGAEFDALVVSMLSANVYIAVTLQSTLWR